MTSRSPLGVLVVEGQLSDDGAARVTAQRAARWRQHGARVQLLAVFACDDELPLAVPLVRGSDRRRGWLVTLLLATARAWRLARSADVVVASRELGNGLLVARAASLLARRPLAVTVQSRWDLTFDEHTVRGTRRLTRWALRSADALVPVAEGLRGSLRLLGADERRIHPVANGVDVDAVRRAAAAAPDVHLPAPPFVVAVGRLSQPKGFDVLVRAHAQLVARGAPEHRLVILGEGDERGPLEALAAACGVGDTVLMPGFTCPHPVMARASLFVLPSRYEGWPLALTEAVVLGVPVVATDCVSGPREVLRGGAFGELVPVDDVDALAAAVLRHLERPERLQGLAAAGAAAAHEAFDVGRAAADHLALLEDLPRRARAGQPVSLAPR